MFHGLLILDLGDDGSTAAEGAQLLTQQGDVGGVADETDRDEIGVDPGSEGDVTLILFREHGQVNEDAGEIDVPA